MKSIFEAVIDVVFPKLCLGCESILPDNEFLVCGYCRYEMPLTNHLYNLENESFKKFYGLADVTKVASLLYYEKDGIVQNMLHELKYKNQQKLGVLLANMFEDEINKSNFIENNSCIVPVPLHPKKYKERGYNQITSFCETLSKNHKIPVDNSILKRVIYNKSQTTKNLLQRNVSVPKNIFALSNTALKEKHIVLVDDVLTTGATLLQCIKVLKEIPNKNISVLTIAFAHS